jgi:hypothetical protein
MLSLGRLYTHKINDLWGALAFGRGSALAASGWLGKNFLLGSPHFLGAPMPYKENFIFEWRASLS